MHNKNRYLSAKQTYLIAGTLSILLTLFSPNLWAIENVSLKIHPQTGVIVDNPMEIKSLPHRKTYQVKHEAFTLQFFFNEKDIFGVILKRDERRPIHFRWCLFRSCEESKHDYKKVIAENSSPPFVQGFFSIPYPFYLTYGFQGIEFSSPD
jgi:hypothetical protein|tara:strand:- start:518 stop:970 length:453 start_codon:yes stop_codon:yes gene_type:complete